MTEEKILGSLVIIAVLIAALYLLKDTFLALAQGLLPNKAAPAATETGTTATGAPIVGSDVKYVNPIICALSGRFCDPNEGTPATSANIVGKFEGYDIVAQDNGYTVTKPGEITTLYCERDPSLQIQKVNNIVAKMNKGISPTLDEARWAKRCEPALFNMLGSDLKSAVNSSVGVV